jgi:hypothetical protein
VAHGAGLQGCPCHLGYDEVRASEWGRGELAAVYNVKGLRLRAGGGWSRRGRFEVKVSGWETRGRLPRGAWSYRSDPFDNIDTADALSRQGEVLARMAAISEVYVREICIKKGAVMATG